MKVLYIADNRNRHNYGCRATSAALSELISQNNTISGRITGKLTLSNSDIYIPFFSHAANYLTQRFSLLNRAARKIVSKLPNRVKNKFSIVSMDFDRSIKRIRLLPKYNKKYEEINLDLYDYDAIVINGEGTMIMTTPPRTDTLYYLLFVYWAKKRNKKVFFVNAMFSDCPKSGRNEQILELSNSVLSKCDLVTARDPLSFQYVHDYMPLIKCKYVPDALFSWYTYVNEDAIKNTRVLFPFGYESDINLAGVDLSGGYVCISGSSAAAWNQEDAVKSYIRMVTSIKEITELPIILLEVCDGDAFLRKVADETNTIFVPVEIPIMIGFNLLSHATVYVSGRYHPSIMASLGGTPCVFLGSNSHKNIGLQYMLEYDNQFEFHACPLDSEYGQICDQINAVIGRGIIGRKRIRDVVAQRSSESSKMIDLIK